MSISSVNEATNLAHPNHTHHPYPNKQHTFSMAVWAKDVDWESEKVQTVLAALRGQADD